MKGQVKTKKNKEGCLFHTSTSKYAFSFIGQAGCPDKYFTLGDLICTDSSKNKSFPLAGRTLWEIRIRSPKP